VVRPALSRIGRSLSPSALILAGICFAFPFVTVACDTPGGFGRAAPGGTTSYSGVDLIFGSRPDVGPPDKLRPAPAGQDDRLWPQPAAGIVLVLIVAGTALSITLSDRRVRRATVAALAGVAATALLVNQALVESELAVRVGEQLTQPLPAGKAIRDYVNTGPGFVFCLALLVPVSLVNAVGWLRARPRPALVAEEEPTVRQP
jgi:hypothetical protein